MFKFYPAGKIWHAPKFQALRTHFGDAVNARWIDYTENHSIVQHRKGELWQHCLEDVASSDFLLLYAEEQAEEQRGALVEVGMAFSLGKPVFAIGSCNSTKPNEISDVAFTHHVLWSWLPSTTLLAGAYLAQQRFHAWKQINQAA
jgi:nucleoside 2-deoxyribosyltransferase